MKTPPNNPSPSTSSSSSSSSSVLDDRQPNHSARARKRARSLQTTSHINSNNTRRSSVYRGVTRHRWTGRFEAHLWDKSSYNTVQNKKGKQVYLGAYDCEDDAARTYDMAALKYWGPQTLLNFPRENYIKELEEMQNVSKEEYLASLRRRSSGFSRGVSKYRGVAKHHHNGRWEARIGRVLGNKYLYLGTFSSQEEAAKAYDIAAIQHRGRNAVTNFDINNYIPKDENPGDTVIQPHQEKKQEEEEEERVLDSSSELANAFNESPILAMDDPGCGINENPWSFGLDYHGGGLLFPHILQDGDEEDLNLLYLLDEKPFEDNIDLIFNDDGKKATCNGVMGSSSPSSSSTVSSLDF